MTEETKTAFNAYGLYESDKRLEAVGQWVPVGPFQFKLARAGGANEKFMKEASKRFKPFQAAINTDTMPKDMADALVIGIFADTIVLDWKNVAGRDGETIPFSKEACVKLFMDLPNLFAEVQAESMKMSNFRSEQLEEGAKN